MFALLRDGGPRLLRTRVSSQPLARPEGLAAAAVLSVRARGRDRIVAAENETFQSVADFLAHNLKPGDKVLLEPVGMIGWSNPRLVILAGLVSPEIAARSLAGKRAQRSGDRGIGTAPRGARIPVREQPETPTLAERESLEFDVPPWPEVAAGIERSQGMALSRRSPHACETASARTPSRAFSALSQHGNSCPQHVRFLRDADEVQPG